MSIAGMAVACLLVAPSAEERPWWPTRAVERRLLLQQRLFDELEKAMVESQERFERTEADEDEPWERDIRGALLLSPFDKCALRWAGTILPRGGKPPAPEARP